MYSSCTVVVQSLYAPMHTPDLNIIFSPRWSVFSRTPLWLKFVSVSLLSLALSPLRLPPIFPCPWVVEPPPRLYLYLPVHSLRRGHVRNDFTVCTNTDSIAEYIFTTLHSYRAEVLYIAADTGPITVGVTGVLDLHYMVSPSPPPTPVIIMCVTATCFPPS